MVANSAKGTIENLLQQYIMYLLDEEFKALKENKACGFNISTPNIKLFT